MTDDAIFYFTEQAIADYAASLGPLGSPSSFVELSHSNRGGMTERMFIIQAGGKRMSVETYIQPDGKFAQYMLDAAPVAPSL